MREQTFRKTTPQPTNLYHFIGNRIRELFGLVLLCSGIAVAASLFSHDSSDPSWNVAIDAAAHNLVGDYGAIVSDLLLQSFGVLAWVIPVVLGFWGSFIFVGRRLRFFVARFFFLPFLITIMGAAARLLGFKLKTGFLVGIFLHELQNVLFISSALNKWAGPIMLVIALVSLFGISGFMLADIQKLFRVSIFAGSFTYFLARRGKAIFYKHGDGKFRGERRDSDVARSKEVYASLAGRISGLFQRKRAAKPERRIHAFREPVFGEVADHCELENGTESTVHGRESEVLSGELSKSEAGFDIDRPLIEEARPTSSPIDTVQERKGRSKKEAHIPSKPSRAISGQDASVLDLACGEQYYLPPMELLNQALTIHETPEESDGVLQEKARQLMSVLEEFGVRGQITRVRPGPVVTLYELVPAAGTKTSRVVGLADDIARSMCALSARIAVVPGQNALGIELPNTARQMVYLRELMSNTYFDNPVLKLALALGKDISGAPVITDLARMPHLLVAGTTGSGKSVAINTMILSLLYRLPPERCRFIMIDPKMLELSVYDGIPHLLAPVVTDPKKAIYALKWTVREMEDRYRAMSRLGVRNIEGYNARLQEARNRGEVLTRQVQTGFDPETGQAVYEVQPLGMEPFPYIVVVVDEMADLMMVAGKEIEAAVQRLAQMARAAGIHLIMATQRPSVDVITGTIKANFPTRISFQVTSRFDSRTILGEQGAEQLLGRGDMLFMEPGGKIQRVHGPFVTDEEVEKVVRHLKAQGSPDYIETITEDAADTPLDSFESGETEKGDQLYRQAVALVQREGKASTSFVQRHLQIGYNRAARIIEQMETEGIISAANHVGKREVLNRGNHDR